MKGCFLLQRRFCFFGHAIAKVLRAKYGVNEFCGYTYLRSAEKFLKSQKDFVYEPLLVDEDLHLAAKNEPLDYSYLTYLEAEYGVPNLWPFLISDRHFMMNVPKYEYSDIPACSHEEMLKHLQIRFRTVIKMLREEKPDFVFFSSLGSLGTMALYWVAKKMGITTLVLDDARVQKRVVVTDNCFNQFSEANKAFDQLRAGERTSPCRSQAVDFLNSFRDNPSPRVLNPQSRAPFLSRFPRWAGFFAKYIVSYIKEGKRDYLIESPYGYFRNKILGRLKRWRGYRDLFEKPIEGEDFAFFPLHYEPESTTLLLAPFYVNQLALIQNIAKSMPLHFKLYVKEHPAMLYRRPRSYYKALKKIPNVRLINMNEKSVSLIKKAKLVLTITGTAGWEAVLLKKPVITFGSVFYNKLSWIRRVESIEKLPFLIKDALENYIHNEKELIDFLSAIFEESFAFEPNDYEYVWHELDFEDILRQPSFGKFVDFVAGKLELAEKNKTENRADDNIADIADDQTHQAREMKP